MKIALVQMDVQIGEPDVNFQKAEAFLEEAIRQQPDLIILPEMWNTGYALEQADQLADVNGERTKQLFSSFARKHQVVLIAGSVLNKRTEDEKITNTMYIFNRQGELLVDYDKIHLFRLMDEHNYLTAGDQLCLFDYDEDVKIGAMICYDLRFPQLSRTLVNKGAKVLINTAQWPSARVDHWRSLLIARAIENQSFMIAVNRTGTSRDTEFPGHSMVIDPLGRILLETNHEEDIYYADIDLQLVDEVRQQIPVMTDQRLDIY
ncbi:MULTISPECIES: carbon-nitrogen family hydrolase [Bacillus]|uniref:carbon-nitrogen family hydrolase n=1 Tax=Bacillus TaxID=1386 RepID=UPI0011A55664|nr:MULTISPECIES: carbon-nitrogen family hydrolase [Bacillus]MBU8655935.1 carbon-nitrogen family hydrolase [Bacillus pumilus]MBU8727613.1 carbon-nitrogen family hydrolase [Bacillus pumilus]MCP1147133.1 carbon-nitrogen family hydrolase [Bacillus sp. 1735sda2]